MHADLLRGLRQHREQASLFRRLACHRLNQRAGYWPVGYKNRRRYTMSQLMARSSWPGCIMPGVSVGAAEMVILLGLARRTAARKSTSPGACSSMRLGHNGPVIGSGARGRMPGITICARLCAGKKPPSGRPASNFRGPAASRGEKSHNLPGRFGRHVPKFEKKISCPKIPTGFSGLYKQAKPRLALGSGPPPPHSVSRRA